MSVDRKVPEIRFKGFGGEWDKRKMLDCSSKIGDGLHGTPKYTDNTGIYFINGNNLVSGSISITNETKQVGREEQSKDDTSLDFNTLLLSINGTIGNLAWYQGQNVMLGKSVAFITLENCDNRYMYTYLQTERVRNYFLNSLTGSTIKNLGLKAIRESIVLSPDDKEEQAQIGNTFQKLDSLINQHQQKHDKLSNIKKAMLEKMFPKQGETIPEIRFKGFSGEWISAALSKVADKYDNFRIPVTAKDRISGNTPYYGANGIQGYIEGYTHDGEYVLLAEDGANDLKNYPIHYVNGKVWVNNHAHVLRAQDKNSNLFLKYALVTIDFEPFLVGGGRAKLNASIMMDLELTVTEHIEEQEKIGNTFQKLDTLINQHQQQITKLNNIKQACLSKMFV